MSSKPSRAAQFSNDTQERLDFAAASSGCGFWEWDLASDHLLADSTSVKRFALDTPRPARELFDHLVHPNDLSLFLAAVGTASDVASTVRIRMLSADGSFPDVDVVLKARHGAAGRAVMLSTRDVSDAAARTQSAFLDRISLAIAAAGVTCWEFSYVEERFTWFDRPPDIHEPIVPEDEIAVRRATEQALADGEETLSSVMRRRDPAGRIRHCKLQQRFFRDAAGKPLRAVGTTRDITAEVMAQQALSEQTALLQETQRRLDRTSLSLQEGHWELELPTHKHWASKGYLELLGLTADSRELDTLSQVLALVHPDDMPEMNAATHAHLRGGPPYSVESRMRSVDGSYRWYRLRGVAELDAHGTPVRLSGSIHDIQKQREAEDALREVEGRFTRAIHGTQDGLWETNLDEGTMWLSPRLIELLGYQEGELPTSQFVLRELVHPEDLTATDASIIESDRLQRPIDLEARMRTKSGEYRWYRMRGTPAVPNAAGGRRGSGSIQDVTEARLARDTLIQATEDAQAANRAKSGFLANVSHEIRTPMNGIIGMTRLLLDTRLDPTQHDYTETIRSSADSLLTVINDLLDFSKIEAGKLDIETLEMDLPGNVEDVATIMSFQAAGKNLELIVNVHPDLPKKVRGDPQRIRQCMINLMGNAIKFTSSGEIVCEVGVIAGSTADTVHVRFAVHDTGIGISADILETLFQPFTQADVSTTRHHGGTGLGLSIVHRLVEMMGGKTGAESQLGKGSTFWFTLPMVRAEAPLDVATPVPSAARRVLIVDDNETNRRVLESQLAYAGYEVMLAKTGREALMVLRSSIARGVSIDVALIDFQMPDMDGGELGRTIVSDPQLLATRVVLLTSLDLHGDVARFAALGFAGYLAKPVRIRDLLRSLERVLQREAQAWHLRTQPIVTNQDSLRESGGFAGKVLLIEDNAVNQKVALRFLERMGCEVTVAENGEQGVRACQHDEFNLVLMDVQMPVMDGYTASRQIRSLETPPAHVPIVALTANAMAGQLEKCLEAGMDALLTKPLDVERLEEVLERFGLAATASTAATPASPIDFAKLSELTAGDTEFAAELMASYLASSSELSTQIDRCAALGDRRQLAHAVHQLGGASANIHAAPLRALCSKLEEAARSSTAGSLAALVKSLHTELARVHDALTAASATGPPARLVNGL